MRPHLTCTAEIASKCLYQFSTQKPQLILMPIFNFLFVRLAFFSRSPKTICQLVLIIIEDNLENNGMPMPVKTRLFANA